MYKKVVFGVYSSIFKNEGDFMKNIISISIIISLLLVTPIHSNVSKGNYIIINNQSTNPYTTQSTGSFQSQKSTSISNEKTSTPYPIDKVLSKSENANLYHLKIKSDISLETTREFITVNFKTNTNEKIYADLKYSSEKANIWVYDNQITDMQAKRLGDEFDNKIYPLINQNFGQESDVDCNSKIDILIYDIKDNFTNINSYVQGYFNQNDLYNTQTSNKGEILYIDTYPTMDITNCDNNQGSENLYPIIVHEFQHMVSYNENVIKENKCELDNWIDEGLSLAAEQLYTNKPRMDRINYYNISSSIENGHSLLYWDSSNSFSNYSLSYLFFSI